MLSRPAALGAPAVVVSPDDLVEEALTPEDLIEQQLAVVGLAVVDVEVQGALAREQPAGLLQARREKREIVIEAVAVAGLGEQPRGVAPALEPHVLAVRVPDRLQCLARLHLAGVERRVDVHELEGLVGERRQQLQVLTEEESGRFPGMRSGSSLQRDYVRAPMEMIGMQSRAASAQRSRRRPHRPQGRAHAAHGLKLAGEFDPS